MNLNDLETSKIFFEEGNKKFDLDNLQGALNEYSKSIQFNPNNVDAYFNRGAVRFELNLFNDAISDFSKVIYFSPRNEIAFFKRGETYFQLKDYYSAIDDLTKVIFFNSESEDAYFKRGLAKSKIGNFQGSIDDFSKAIEINSRFVEAIYSRGLVKKKVLDNTADFDLKNALQLKPDYRDIYFEKISDNSDKDEKLNKIDLDFEKSTQSYKNEENETVKYKENYEYENKNNREMPRNSSKPIVMNNSKKSKFEDTDAVYLEKENNRDSGKNIYNYNYVNTNKNDNSPISGWFILIFFIVSSLIAGILIANGNYMEAVGVVFVSGVLIDIFALFWRPSRKAIGLLNIILGILLMLSFIGFPFGIFLLLFGAILMFI